MEPREKHATLAKSNGVRIDIKQTISGKKVKDFAINISVLVGSKRKDVFRVDTAHGYLHTQEFWVSDKPIKLQDKRKKDYTGDFGAWKDKVLRNYEEYIKFYKNKLNK